MSSVAALMPPEIARCMYVIEFPAMDGTRLFGTLQNTAQNFWDERCIRAKSHKNDCGDFLSGTLEIIFDEEIAEDFFGVTEITSHTFRILLGGEPLHADRMYEEIVLYPSRLAHGMGIWKPLPIQRFPLLESKLRRLKNVLSHTR